ncbi:hypothetical protein OHA04_04590 [Streptomyces sp. NBC_01590]|uniref:hypothetical protein n=1 Tax=Streptomyces sp. NBC_01590 TaxID=2975887 RepID=UPI00386DCF27
MTLSEAVDIRQIAARAALAVPGVAGLQPTLGHRLASVAVRVSQTVATAFRPPEAGIQAERRPRSSGWHVEVRCVLNGERRALDTARDVRRQVRSALTAHLAQHGTPEPITVLVTITRIMSQTS